MAAPSDVTDLLANHVISRCYLTTLPTELQIQIYELVVIHDEPLLLNCPCDSSFHGRYVEERKARDKWNSNEERPPEQPAIARTCRIARRIALPIFYRENIFRAGYCDSGWSTGAYEVKVSDLGRPVEWLRLIGEENRELLQHLYFYDANPNQDERDYDKYEAITSSEIVTEWGGRVENLNNADYCAHWVTFGDHEAKHKRKPLTSKPGKSRLILKQEDLYIEEWE